MDKTAYITDEVNRILMANSTYKNYEAELLKLYMRIKQALPENTRGDLMRYDELTCAQNAFVINFVIKNLHHFVPLKFPQNII